MPLLLLAVLAALPASSVAAQTATQAQASPLIRSSEISLSRTQALLHLDLVNGRSLDLAISDGRVLIDGDAVGTAQRGGRLDQAWRELLNRAIDASPADLPGMLIEWDPPAGDAAGRLDAVLESMLRQGSTAAYAPADVAVDVTADAAVDVTADADASAEAVQADGQSLDTIEALNDEIRRLRGEIQAQVREVRLEQRRSSGPAWSRPFRHIVRGIGGILSVLVAYAVIFGIGLAVIFFGGRRYIEGVADTARHQTLRSLFVGLAGACLIIPAFILGIIALAISIVGIPALLAWIPLFPLATILALMLGYLAVAHAAGEALAERRFYATDWFRRGNSYYFLMTGIGVLVAFFLASQVVSMAGPWLGFFTGLLIFLGVVTTIAALTIGFGAVLISRAGTRPLRNGEPDLFSEESIV